MATTSIQSLHHPFHHNHHSLFSTSDSPLSLRLHTPHKSISISTASSSSILTPTTPTFDLLTHHLASSDFRRADDETRRLLIALAGEPAQTRGYVFFSEVQFISSSDLATIDRLWRAHSDGRFGYSVQRRLWDKSLRDFTRLFIRLGWMKKLDTEVEQHNYRAFPDEFIWELSEDTPEGHLPLTNALRGTQLMANILGHPAFERSEEESEAPKPSGVVGGDKMGFKTDYKF